MYYGNTLFISYYIKKKPKPTASQSKNPFKLLKVLVYYIIRLIRLLNCIIFYCNTLNYKYNAVHLRMYSK